MSLSVMQWGFLAIALLLANLPWLSQRCFLILQCDSKSPWLRVLEWLLLYVLCGALAMGLEYKVSGSIYPQGWEFYWVTFFLFMVSAFPGFIYRYVR
ncbi:MAG: DUF2818 family protein [Thiothrix sp.]|uniref:DUF2818 family protein n=1 Tax=Thiothrix sp. TaxID=1032 RepID=UPI00263057AB|nr:DUF2818 family protein [Thiothrix sp.]MDD5394523.1 DUF2818 family protein [Thiothrix sp.]